MANRRPNDKIAAQRRYIATMRRMNPDAVLSGRLDRLEEELNRTEPKDQIHEGSRKRAPA